MMMKRRCARLGAKCLGALALCVSGTASAQELVPPSNGAGMDTHLFRPAIDSRGFFAVNGTEILSANKLSFGMVLDWGHTLMRANADAVGTDALIADSFQGTVSASYGIANFMVLGLSVPVNLMSGEAATGLGPAGGLYSTDQLNSQKFQSVIPHAKFRILRVQNGLGLAVVAQAGIPLASAERDMGADAGFWYWPRAILEKRFGQTEKVKVALDVGYRGHTGDNPTFAAGQLAEGELTYGDLITYGLGVSYRILPKLDLVAENYGSVLYADKNATEQRVSSEFLGGVKLFIEENSYLMAAGGSRAFFTGFEAADVRVVLGFVYEPSAGDRDGDGIPDDRDACPDEPEDFDGFEDSDGCPDPDNDGDGIPDHLDRCPNIPEDFDGDEDHDGCPEGDKRKDRDGDGIPDELDQCPDEPEDKDGFQDEDGCPDPDNDGDGIPDELDQCPNDAEDFDGFEDEDGCPERDNDLDGIPDELDQCPNDPETYNGFEDEDGCPDKGKVIIDGSNIVILEKIQFATGSAKILNESLPIVEAVAATLKGHPEFLVLEVAGHADERGADEMNLRLTQQRAAAVRDALIQRGIEEKRLVSQGYGEYCPVDNRSTQAAWDKNRRVDFQVVKTTNGMTGARRGCEKARAAGIFSPEVK